MAGVQSTTVLYTGGSILTNLLASGQGTVNGSLSFSLEDVSPSFSSVNGSPILPFTANGTGLFSARAPVPEAGAAMLGMPAVMLLARRRRA